MPDLNKPIPIFMSGEHTAMDGRKIVFTPEICADLADSYDPTLSEAPLVIGHPKLTSPAYGWAETLHFDNGVVSMTPKQVNPDFAEAVNSGAYKKRSASIYLPNSPGNPKPGHHYLRHVGWLGATPPSIKGLEDVCFSEPTGTGDDFVEFALPIDLEFTSELLISMLRGLRDYIIERDNLEIAEKILPQWRIDALIGAMAPATDLTSTHLSYSERQQEKPVSEAKKEETKNIMDFSERENSITAREALLTKREQEIAEREAKERRTETANFAEGLVTGGHVHPNQRIALTEALLAIDVSSPVSFALGEQMVSQSPSEIIRAILSSRPAIVDFSEKSSDEGADSSIDFADPSAVAQQAQQYQDEQKQLGRSVSVTDAINHVKKAK